jgi:hypothetical protein
MAELTPGSKWMITRCIISPGPQVSAYLALNGDVPWSVSS